MPAVLSTSGPLLSFRSSTASNTAVDISSVKNCELYYLNINNTNAAAVYIKFYNKTGSTSSDTPVRTFYCPVGMLILTREDCYFRFSTAMSVRVVTDFADNGTTSPTASSVLIEADYFEG